MCGGGATAKATARLLAGFLNISRQEFFAPYIHHHLRSRVKVAFLSEAQLQEAVLEKKRKSSELVLSLLGCM